MQDQPFGKQLLNKVPEITIYFWVIKILCTTVGETAADYLNTTLNFGLNGTTLVMGLLFFASLIVQLRVRQYVPWIYWLTVVLISVFGTLITDNLTDNLGISLITTTTIFSIILAIIFAVWYKFEKTLSIHTITSFRRESFYWLAILFTFALGTAAGDLTAEQFSLGYLPSVLLFAGLIALVTAAWRFRVHAMLTFWIAYILTRPLGASIGDYLSQGKDNGGLGLGTVITSAIFLTTIVLTVLYLVITKKDVIKKR